MIKRIWTSPRYSTLEPGDENYPLWHLPAEKRYGISDLYQELTSRDFALNMEPEAFRRLAALRCGLPRRTASKTARDGIRQVAAKLGLRL